jgi:arylformamidase
MSQDTQAVSEQWIDIAIGLHDGMVHWSDNPPLEIGFMLAIEKGDASNVSKISMGAHTGTHMDAPLHFIPGGQSIDTMPFSATIGRARVIEIQDTESIRVAELEHHNIQMGERILLKTINSTQYWQTDEFEKNFVFISKKELYSCSQAIQNHSISSRSTTARPTSQDSSAGTSRSM